MLSLANTPLPTILDYAVRWYTVNCKACDQPVDVTTIRDEDDPVVAWKTNWYFAFHCPECIVDAAPGDQKPRLAALYRHLRETRHEVGLSGAFESIDHSCYCTAGQPGPLYQVSGRGRALLQ